MMQAYAPNDISLAELSRPSQTSPLQYNPSSAPANESSGSHWLFHLVRCERLPAASTGTLVRQVALCTVGFHLSTSPVRRVFTARWDSAVGRACTRGAKT